MAAYKDLVGQKITKVTSNPPEPKTGQMWYNSTSKSLRALSPVSAWRSSAPILVARDAAGSAGTQTTATIFGGNINPGNTSATDEYNGSGFSSGGALNTARRQTTGCGLQTAALCVGGYTTANAANVEEYNGTSWSEQNDIPSNSRNGSTFGTQTAALYVGGYTVPVPNSDVIQIYDGTNWTTSPATLGTGGNSISSTGTSTAGLVFGGSNRLNLTEEWNGSAMSAGGNMSTSKYGRGSANQAPSENAMSAGGGIPAQTTVENYDGTSWSTLPSLAVATNDIRGAGTATSAMMMGGGPGAGPVFNTSTEFDKSTNTITAAAWASATAMNTGRGRFGASGGKDSALAAGGYTVPSNTSNTEKYDGTSWTETGNLPTAKNSFPLIGSQTASIACGGYTPPTYSNASDTFDGSSWTSAPTMGTGRESAAGSTASPYNAVVVYGGYAAAAPNIAGLTEEFNGTSWSEQNDMPTALLKNGGGGTQTAAISSGGAPPASNLTQFYDGTNWTTGPATLLNTQQWHGYAGTQTANFIFGGSTNPDSNSSGVSQVYDGSSWATAPNLGTPRYAVGGSGQGTPTSASAFGGLISPIGPGAKNFTEEFTAETTAANIADFSTE